MTWFKLVVLKIWVTVFQTIKFSQSSVYCW